MAKFDSTVTSLFEMWTPAWSSADTNRFLKGFFSLLDRMVLFLSSLGLLFFFSSFRPLRAGSNLNTISH